MYICKIKNAFINLDSLSSFFSIQTSKGMLRITFLLILYLSYPQVIEAEQNT